MSMARTAGSNGTIPPDMKRELEAELATLLAREQPPITTDLEEHAVLLRLLDDAQSGGATPVNGEIQRFRPGLAVDYENEGVLEQTTEKRSIPPSLRLALMGVAVVAIIGVLALNSVLAPAKPARTAALTPSAKPTTSAVAEPTLTQEPLGAVRIGNIALPPVYPNALGIGDRQWMVNVAAVDKGTWKVLQQANSANWLAGSVVNWSFGLWNDADGANAAVFNSLRAETTATLYLSSGATRVFKLGTPWRVARPAITIFSQQAPGLTIALIGGDTNGDRVIVRGIEADGAAAQTPTQTEPPVQP